MTNESKRLYNTWMESGGDLSQYMDEYWNDIEGELGGVSWHPSRLKRWYTTLDAFGHSRVSRVREKLQDLDRELDHLRWKHRHSETWMHVKSGVYHVGEGPVGFKAYVTIEGQKLTVGEYIHSEDPHEVFEWALEWMREHPDGYPEE